MDKFQLKRLIKEVLNELDATTDNDVDIKGTSDDVMKHSIGAKQHENDVVIKLTTKGNKPGAAFKKVMIAMAHAAKMADLEIIHGEVEKAGKKVITMDSSEIKSQEKQYGHNDAAFGSAPKTGKINMAKLSPEQRLAMIQPGEKESEWKAATEKDMADTKNRTRLKNSRIAAGTYDRNDTTLWTDKEWDAYNQLISKDGAPTDNAEWDEDEWALFDKYTKGDEEGNWSPSHSKKVEKPLAKVGAGLGTLNQNG